MLSKFFLDRPVFAWVIAIVIMLVGVSRHLQPTHITVPSHRSAVDLY